MSRLDYNEKVLFYLLRVGLQTENDYSFSFKEIPDWKYIFKLSSKEGVLAIVFDGLKILIDKNLIEEGYRPSHSFKLQISANIMNIEDVYARQYSIANEIADKFKENNLTTAVLKGIAIAVLYPTPNHRPCGDFDCFLLGNFDKGNKVLDSMGAKSEKSFYKHSHYIYKNLLIENHQFCTAIIGPKKNKDFERELQKLLNVKELQSINATNLLSPSPLFNASFLTVHSWYHFITENVGLRHICDWAMLINRYNDVIDWERFIEIINIRDKKMLVFARCVSYISHFYMGVPMPKIFNDCQQGDRLGEQMLDCVLHESKKDPLNKESYWTRKLTRIKYYLLGDWKYKEFSEDNRFVVIYNHFYRNFFESNPHL